MVAHTLNSNPGWCEEQGKAAIEAVLALDTPINLGLIGIGLDDSELLTDFLASVADNPLIEMASHSFQHESFEGQSFDWQAKDLADLNDMSNKVRPFPLPH
jgi:hypothetical protein